MSRSNSLTILCYLLLALFASCQNAPDTPKLQAGDLLFQDLNCGPLCDAIEAVTEGIDGRDFSHCGLVVEVNGRLKVVEAIGKGVQINSIHDFFARSGDTAIIQNIVVARLKPAHQKHVSAASSFSLEQVGAPYDEPFILDNGRWYCSELVYEAFHAASGQDDFFALNPMTFKDPTSQDFFPAWVDYYTELGAEIPEGKLGTNPGLISRSEKLEVVDFHWE